LSDYQPDEDQISSPARPGAWRGPALVAVLILVAGGLIVWYALQRESPTIVVQRFCSAMKGQRWSEAYKEIDWPADRAMDEQSFIQTCKAASAFATIQKYKIGEPRHVGDATVVPVTATISLSLFGPTKERTDTIDMSCRLVEGKWKVRPEVGQGFLGFGKPAAPGLK
jgi:hypothetical protein